MYDHLQLLHEFSMAIGTSLDLRTMLRKSISTILRQLNCQAGVVLFYTMSETDKLCLEPAFSIPREVSRLQEYRQLLDSFPETFDSTWKDTFTDSLPRHIQASSGKHLYLFELPDLGFCLLMKNEDIDEPFLIKSFVPLFRKLATACKACLQNQELLEHRRNLEAMVSRKTDELLRQNEKLAHHINERQSVEKVLRETQERYEAVIQQANEGIFLVDPVSKKILDHNPSFQRLLGYSRRELMTIDAYDFVIDEPENIDANIARILKKNEAFFGERKYKAKDGTVLDIEASGNLIYYSGQKVILVIIRDRSELKKELHEKERLKEQLRQAQKFEALGTLAGGVAHDLNNILSGVVSYPGLLLNKLPEESDLRRPLEIIHDSGQRAATIVADLLTMARSAASTKEIHCLNTLVEEYLASPEYLKVRKDHRGVFVLTQCSPHAPHIFCSPVHIKKCVMNLFNNAAEAIKSGGTISIKTYVSPIDKEGGGHENAADSHVVLEVGDDGPGIDQVDLEHIFEPFYTKKKMGKSGTGLGLTIVWNTMQDHAGDVSVQSDEAGTRFRLIFPMQEKVVTEHQEQPVPEMSKKQERILVVDDEEVLRAVATEMLEFLGYQVDTVSSGEQAIDFVQQNPVDLLIIDMIMDPGISGLQTYQTINQKNPGLKAIIASGYSESEMVESALRLGANGFIQKPYSLAQMEKAVLYALQAEHREPLTG